MDIKTALAQAGALLQKNDIEQPRLDAEVLLCHLLNCQRAYLYAHADQQLTEAEVQNYRHLLDRRVAGQPVAYLVGSKEFMGLDFAVTPDVLIPRPDTELLVETAIQLINQAKNPTPILVDVGTGSGAIAVSTAHFLLQLKVVAVDISAAALAVAQKNATRHQVARRIEFVQGNLLAPALQKLLTSSVDIITANLPYVPSQDIAGLSQEVRQEPILALDGGPDGLDLYRMLKPQALQLLKPGGHLLIEIGPGQGDTALSIFSGPEWDSKLYHDLADRERLVVAQKILL
ncbi:peptide chain release factor N(5)-glutamine methyltransferase [Peptococcaceae bacterium 1198_IL3148]